jgi:hypothetical protein
MEQQPTRVISTLFLTIFIEWLVALHAYAEGRSSLPFLGVWLAHPNAPCFDFGTGLQDVEVPKRFGPDSVIATESCEDGSDGTVRSVGKCVHFGPNWSEGRSLSGCCLCRLASEDTSGQWTLPHGLSVRIYK